MRGEIDAEESGVAAVHRRVLPHGVFEEAVDVIDGMKPRRERPLEADVGGHVA